MFSVARTAVKHTIVVSATVEPTSTLLRPQLISFELLRLHMLSLQLLRHQLWKLQMWLLLLFSLQLLRHQLWKLQICFYYC